MKDEKRTTFADCERDLLARGGQPLLESWKASDRVQAFTKRFEHVKFHRITLAEMDEWIRRVEEIDPPLGKAQAKHAIPQVDDYPPDFTLAHMFHMYLELKGPGFTYAEWLDFLKSPEQRDKCYAGFEAILAALDGYGFNSQHKENALRWRFGNAYGSALRELYTAAWLREHGKAPHYHVFADTQLQTDAWYENTLICLRVPNWRLKRKLDPSAWARSYHVVRVDIAHQGKGKVWRPNERQLRTLAGLEGKPGTVTTIYPDGTTQVETPFPEADRLVTPVVLNVPDLDTAVQQLGLTEVPRYSVTMVGTALRLQQALALLKAGIKVVHIAAQPPDWPELKAFAKAGLLSVLPLPAKLSTAVPLPCVIIDGKYTGQQRTLLVEIGAQLPRFNVEQWFVEHASPQAHLQVGAGAGTGKTAVMVQRVMFLMHMVDDLSLADITMITFTREATRVMRERLRRAIETRYRLTGNPRYLRWLEELSFMQVSTIPSFARRLLKAVGSVLGYGQNFRIREFGRDRELILGQILDENLRHARAGQRLRDILRVPLYQFVDVANRYWTEMENKGLGPDQIQSLDWGAALGTESRSLQAIWPDLFKEAERRLQLLKERSNAISLSDLTRQIQMVGKHLSSLGQAGLSIKYLFVDEFQDSDDTQIRLVASLQQVLGARVFVVGDVKQSIYRFRGATYTAFEALSRLLAANGAQLEPFTLRKNYRTSANLLAEMTPFFEAWGAQGWLPYKKEDGLVGVVEEDGELRYAVSDAREDDPALQAQVMAWIREARQTAPEDERVAVLVRTNRQAAVIKRWCDEDDSGVFCQVDQGGTLFASPAAQGLHALVSGLLYPDDPVAMLNLLASPFSACRVPWPALLALKGDRQQLQDFLSKYPPCDGWASNGKDGLLDLKRTEPVLSVLRQALQIMQPVQRYYDQQLADLTARFPNKAGAAIRQEARARALQYQLNLDRIMELIHDAFSEEFATLYALHTWLEIQKATNRNETEPELPEEEQRGRVICVTVHRSKGDEFHTVIVPFTHKRFRVPSSELLLEEKSSKWAAGWMLQTWEEERPVRYRNDNHRRLERTETDEAFMEETRLLYVALTRTQRRLWVIEHEKGQENWGRLLRSVE